jgi:hypothetical protein
VLLLLLLLLLYMGVYLCVVFVCIGSVPWVDQSRHIVQRSVTLLDFHVLNSHHEAFMARGVPFR